MLELKATTRTIKNDGLQTICGFYHNDKEIILFLETKQNGKKNDIFCFVDPFCD